MRKEGKIKAVVFDMDGLMFDTEPIYRFAWQRAAADLGYELNDDIYINLIGLNNEDSERVLVHTFDSNFSINKFRCQRRVYWEKYVLQHGITKKPGLSNLLAALEKWEIPMAIATSSDHKDAVRSLRAAGIKDRFRCIVTGDRVKKGKPAPDIYKAAARKLGFSPHECVALEDSTAGLRAANSAGMLTIMIPDMNLPDEKVSSLAWCILPSLHEVIPLLKGLLCGDCLNT